MAQTYLKNCRMLDGKGNPAVENAVVIYDDMTEKIVYAGCACEAPAPTPEDTVVDCQGYTVMPGLCNVHTHLNCTLPFKSYKYNEFSAGYCALMAYRRAIEGLQLGVTTIRSLGDREYSDIAIRDAINKKMLWGPNIVACGGMLIAHNGHYNADPCSIECSGVPEFRKEARLLLKEGADYLKFSQTGGMAGMREGYTDLQMTDDEVTAVVEVAHMAKKVVSAHLGGNLAIQSAVRLGVDIIEHGYEMTEETVEMIREADRWLVPTLAATHSIEFLIKQNAPSYQLEKTKAGQSMHRNSISLAVKAGVKMAVGTDMLPSDPIAGTNVTVYEAEMLVDLVGMTPLQAVQAATYNGAALCGLGDITGSVEVGKLADLYICEGKPDEDIHALRNLKMVVKSGSLVWSKIPGYERQVLQAVPPTVECAGATFIKW